MTETLKVYDFRQIVGGKISHPGIYLHVDIDLYHSGQLCAGPSVSSTGLKRFIKSPRHFWHESAWNPDAKPSDDTVARRMGKAAHVKAFEPERFVADFPVLPSHLPDKGTGKDKKTPDYKTDEAKAWRQAVLDAGKVPLTKAQAVAVVDMARVLAADPDAREAFSEGVAEATVAAKDEATGLWLLARPDWLTFSPKRSPADYKTSASVDPEKWYKAAQDTLGYHIQAELGLEVIEKVTGDRRPSFWMPAQEVSEPYACLTFQWPDDILALARTRIRDALDGLARCRDAHERGDARAWPAYHHTGPVLVQPTYTTRREMEALAT